MGDDPLAERFSASHGGSPAGVARAPGRVNLIGEHTDYSGGFVLPVAIDREVRLAFRPRADRTVALTSAQETSPVTFGLDDTGPLPTGWGAYPAAVARVLVAAGAPVHGLDGYLDSSVPVGAGLSSSAALELAVARALVPADAPWDPQAVALDCQRAEREHVGVQCGPMDQLISALGRAGHALLIDCRSLEHRAVPVPGNVRIVVLDTSTRRGLQGSAYNERRTQVETATHRLGPGSLREVAPDQLEASGLDPVLLRRARHVVTENRRTRQAAEALAAGDATRVGVLMNASHRSLRNDFEVSGPELDAITDAARMAPGCLGARMTGAGFAGCGVALVDADRVEAFSDQVRSAYRRATGLEAVLHVTTPAPGASL